MQVPAYCPVVEGTQLEEYRGVLVEVKKTIIIEDIGIMVELDADMFISMSMATTGRRTASCEPQAR